MTFQEWLAQNRPDAVSFESREKLAKEAGIKNYSGTSEQNQQLWDYLKGSDVKSPKTNYSGVYLLSDSDDMINFKVTGKGFNAANSGSYAPFKRGNSVPIGHAGNLLIDEKGDLIVFDYGRFINNIYGKKSPKGNVRRFNYGNISAIPGAIKKDGSIDMGVVTTYIGNDKNWSKGRQIHYTKGDASYDEALNYWTTLANNGNRDEYSAWGNNCTSTACRGARAQTLQVGTPGNEGLWIPRQGQAHTYFWNSSDGESHFGPNDILASFWRGIPIRVQGAIDGVRKIADTFKNLNEPEKQKVDTKKQGGSINYLNLF